MQTRQCRVHAFAAFPLVLVSTAAPLPGVGGIAAPQGNPWPACEVTKLLASNPAPGDYFGSCVAVSGDVAVVGVPEDDFPFAGGAGSAYVFVRSGAGWVVDQQITASDKTVNDHFGSSVAVAGDIIVVGVPGKVAPGIGAGAGAAHVFVRGATGWVEEAKLTASDAAIQDFLGTAVGVYGDTAVAGATGDDHAGGTGAGSAYVFRRNGTSWSEEGKLVAMDATSFSAFGSSVAISSGTVAVGVPRADPNGVGNAGAAYVFVRNGSTWSEEAKLVASDADGDAFFGGSVALTGDTILVGATTGGFGLSNGAAYVFVRSGSSWVEEAKLLPHDSEYGDFFGASVAVSGNTAVIGAMKDGSVPSVAYVFMRSGTGWSEQLELIDPDLDPSDEFGGVALAENTVAVGARADDQAGKDAGSAYVFELCPPATVYCTAGASASGCQATLSAVGTASSTAPGGFTLQASTVEGAKEGLFFYGTDGRQANSWGNGTSYHCVVPPTKRATFLAGSGTVGQCDGALAEDLNAFWCPSCPKPHKNPGAGATVQAQLWYRDPLNTSNQTTSLSDAIEFVMGP